MAKTLIKTFQLLNSAIKIKTNKADFNHAKI